MVNNCFLLAVGLIACFPVGAFVNKLFDKTKSSIAIGQVLKMVYCLGLLIICSLLLVDATSNPFLYFRF